MSDPLFERYKEALKAGHVAALRGRLDDALVQYRRAAAIADERALPHASMGSVLLRMGRVEESLSAYHRALERSARDEQSLGGLAEVLVAAGRSGEAADALERLAETVQSGGRAEEALAILRRALALNETERRRRHVRAVERLVQDQQDAAAAEEAAVLSADETAALSPEWVRIEPATADPNAQPSPPDDGAGGPGDRPAIIVHAAAAAPAAVTSSGTALTEGGASVPQAQEPAGVEASIAGRGDEALPSSGSDEAAQAGRSGPPAESTAQPLTRDEPSAGSPVAVSRLARIEPGVASTEAERALARGEDLAADDAAGAVAAFLEAAAAYLRADAPFAAEDACQRALVLAPASAEVHLAFVRLGLASGGRDIAADKLALLGHLLEFDAGPEARERVLAVARQSFPEDPRFVRPV